VLSEAYNFSLKGEVRFSKWARYKWKANLLQKF